MTTLSNSVSACIVCVLFLSSTFASQRKPVRVQITGIYSSMHYIEEAGDVVGMEIFIVDGDDGYYATVQIAEGAPNPPLVVKVDMKGSSVEFILPNHLGENLGKFTGRISPSGIRGKFQNAMKAEFLGRKKSYWQ